MASAVPIPLLTPALRARLPEPAPAPKLDDLELFPPRSYAYWRCSDRGCSSHRPGQRLHLPAWSWAKGAREPQKKPRCQRCGQEQIYVEADQ